MFASYSEMPISNTAVILYFERDGVTGVHRKLIDEALADRNAPIVVKMFDRTLLDVAGEGSEPIEIDRADPVPPEALADDANAVPSTTGAASRTPSTC
jgi:hypothetical protein